MPGRNIRENIQFVQRKPASWGNMTRNRHSPPRTPFGESTIARPPTEGGALDLERRPRYGAADGEVARSPSRRRALRGGADG